MQLKIFIKNHLIITLIIALNFNKLKQLKFIKVNTRI